jgi:Na+/H+ antiporter NhaC
LKTGLLFFFSLLCLITFAQPRVESPEIIIAGIESELTFSQLDPEQTYIISTDQLDEELVIKQVSEYTYKRSFQSDTKVILSSSEVLLELDLSPIPLWLSIIPPLLAILLALIFKEVVSSLLIGIFSGALIIHFYKGHSLLALLYAFMDIIDHYILEALNDSGHLSIIVFSMLIGAMVSVISRNGGMQGVVNRISRYATNPKSGQLATWFLGVAIFFDDYANTLIVGNTMRPVTDRLKISREKLAYLVDSTAAPIAAIALITTWIGAELGYIESGIKQIDGLNESIYSTFISSLSYSFYPILALAFMLILILKQRDFGPMLHAEQRARKGEITGNTTTASTEVAAFNAKENVEHKAYNAIIPIVLVVLGTVTGLLYTGWDASTWNDPELDFGRKLSSTIGNADSYLALLWSSLLGLLVAIKLSVLQKLLPLNEAIEAAIDGLKTMLPAIVILVLAWALALVIEELHTASLITSLLSENISPYLLPAFTFILAALVAFSTGSSWGTMAILYPLMLPTSWQVCLEAGLLPGDALPIFHNVVACVLAGAVLGDHCSPISDTTILSSLASSCNHIEHVRTQMPYALTVGIVAILFGTIPSAYGVPFLITIPLALLTLYGIVHFFGKRAV